MSNSYHKGDLIYVSKPFVHVLDNSQRGILCDYCLKSNSQLLRCSRCGFVYFCNRECQSNAWYLHKYECEKLKECYPNSPTNSLRLMANLIFKLKRNKYECEDIGGYCRTFNELESHVEDIKEDLNYLQRFQGICNALRRFIGEKNLPSAPEMFKIFGKMIINTFSILDNEMQIIGSGLYLGASILDHSCQPNAVVLFDGRILNLRAVEDIPTRNIKMIFISYIDQLETRVKRQQQLKEQYYFNCKCSRCNADFQDVETFKNPENKQTNTKCIKKSIDTLELLKKMKKNKENPFEILTIGLRLFKEQEDIMLPINVLHVRALDIVFDAYIDLSKWEDAVNIGLQTLNAYRYYYGKYHPCLGIQLFRIGKTQLYLEKPKEAEKTLIQAEEILKVSHGTDNSLYQDLLDLLIQCQQDT